MIRINLLAVERKEAKKKKASAFGAAQKVTIACSLVLVASALGLGWWYWTLTSTSAALDQEISAAQQETQRLHTIIQQVQQFEQRKAQLSQRVQLIEQLRKGQVIPVHMLDLVSRSLPDMLWLTQMKQKDNDVTVDGRCTSMNSLSDFVSALEGTGYFKKSVEIISSQTEPMTTPPGELIRFTVKATLVQSADGTPAPAAPAAAPPAAAGAKR